MPGINYETLKTIVNMCNMPSAILAVEKNDDGTCGKILMAATNDKFSMTGEDVEGQPYDLKIPRDPKFEEILFKAAWNNEHYHAYVDTTRLYGYWTEDIVIPINNNGDSKIGYCQFIYNLSKEMDSGKYSIISPDIASFVIIGTGCLLSDYINSRFQLNMPYIKHIACVLMIFVFAFSMGKYSYARTRIFLISRIQEPRIRRLSRE